MLRIHVNFVYPDTIGAHNQHQSSLVINVRLVVNLVINLDVISATEDFINPMAVVINVTLLVVYA